MHQFGIAIRALQHNVVNITANCRELDHYLLTFATNFCVMTLTAVNVTKLNTMYTAKCRDCHCLKLVSIVAEHFTTNFVTVSVQH